MVFVEVPSGSRNKYELDEELGAIVLDRRLFTSMAYPADYGFIEGTMGGDGDPLDVLILCQESVVPLCIMRGRPIGVITMTDDAGRDDKLIAVAVDDPEFAGVNDIADLPPHRFREIKQFLKDYKSLEGKMANVGPLKGASEARKVIQSAIELYRKEIWPNLGHPSTARLP